MRTRQPADLHICRHLAAAITSPAYVWQPVPRPLEPHKSWTPGCWPRYRQSAIHCQNTARRGRRCGSRSVPRSLCADGTVLRTASGLGVFSTTYCCTSQARCSHSTAQEEKHSTQPAVTSSTWIRLGGAAQRGSAAPLHACCPGGSGWSSGAGPAARGSPGRWTKYKDHTRAICYGEHQQQRTAAAVDEAAVDEAAAGASQERLAREGAGGTQLIRQSVAQTCGRSRITSLC